MGVVQLMKEWTAARDHVNEVRKNDARTAEKLSKEITEVGTRSWVLLSPGTSWVLLSPGTSWVLLSPATGLQLGARQLPVKN